MNIFETYTSVEKPTVITKRYDVTSMCYIPYDIVEADGVYSFKYAPLNPEKYDYNGLTDSIISIKYEAREVFAILNNYVAEPENEKYKNEFLELQEWRKFAKAEAKKHFGL